MLNETTIRRGLKTRVFGNRIYSFESIDSTNSCARAVAGCGATEGTVVVADHQTQGKGRLGRTWEANQGENLMFSVVLRPRLTAEGLNLLPLQIAVSLARVLKEQTGLPVECKWPNDLLIGGRKVAGILIEGAFRQSDVDYVVVGVGLNVNQRLFGNDLLHRATSLALAAGREFDRAEILRCLLRGLERDYTRSTSQGFRDVVPEWLASTGMLNKSIQVSQQGSVIEGIVKGLSPEGGLVLSSGGRDTTLFAGDVTILQPEPHSAHPTPHAPGS